MKKNLISLFALMVGVLAGPVMAADDKGAAPAGKSWQQTDQFLALLNDGKVVWQLNFEKGGNGKPCFHPLRLPDGTVFTAFRPPDHPWHRGFWWSWKYINGLNYWEEDRKTGKSQGTTEMTSLQVATNADFSATAEMEFSYHPPKQAPVLTEKRVLVMQPPDAKGTYTIDWTATFTAGAGDVKLDRTPPRQEKNGVSWGGYAGLSVRFADLAKSWTFTNSAGVSAAAVNGVPAMWMDFAGPSGGILILDAPGNLRHPSAWYCNQELPYFSPAIIKLEPFTLPAGKSMTLRYRAVVHAAGLDAGAEWRKFAK